MLIVTEEPGNVMQCVEEHACGSPTVGRGSTVAEAVGDWAVQTGAVDIRCSPPELLKRYKMQVKGWPERS